MRMSQLMRKFLPQPGPALERRLHRRAVDYWRSVLGANDLVLLCDFDLLAIEDDTSHGFLLDLRMPTEPMLSYVGPVLEQEASLSGTPVRLVEVTANCLLSRFAGHHGRALESGKPETAEYDFVTEAGYHVLCRGALLPLSSDGKTVDHVYGVISWKSEKVVQQLS